MSRRVVFCLALAISICASTSAAQTFSISKLKSEFPADIAVADFNRDGRADLATVDGGGSSLRVFLNNGSGGFPDYGSATYFVPDVPTRILARDFDRDGIVDVVALSTPCVTGSASASFSFLKGNGDGTLRSAVVTTLPFCPDTMTAADLTGDGALDLAFSADAYQAPSTIRIYKNDGAATFTPYLTIPSPAPWNMLWGISSGDYNGDGRADLSVIGLGEEPEHILYLLLNNGNATFTPKPIAVIYGPAGEVNTADVNGDGHPDLLVCFWTGVLVVVNNGNATGWTYRSKTLNSEVDLGTRVVVADFNRDGLKDIAVSFSPGGMTSGGIAIFPAVSTTTWSLPRYFWTEPGAAVSKLAAGLINSDTRPDLIVGTAPSTLNLFLNTSLLGCAPPATSPAIRICSPAAASTLTSNVTISATARWDGKTITALRAYVDGASRCSSTGGPSISCTVTLSPGPHVVTVNAWNSVGEVIKSSQSFTVK